MGFKVYEEGKKVERDVYTRLRACSDGEILFYACDASGAETAKLLYFTTHGTIRLYRGNPNALRELGFSVKNDAIEVVS